MASFVAPPVRGGSVTAFGGRRSITLPLRRPCATPQQKRVKLKEGSESTRGAGDWRRRQADVKLCGAELDRRNGKEHAIYGEHSTVDLCTAATSGTHLPLSLDNDGATAAAVFAKDEPATIFVFLALKHGLALRSIAGLCTVSRRGY